MHRMQTRGERIRAKLVMSAKTLPDAPSRNVMGEIVGAEKPDEVVVFGGHIDSWDVGRGAMDDGGGVVSGAPGPVVAGAAGVAAGLAGGSFSGPLIPHEATASTPTHAMAVA